MKMTHPSPVVLDDSIQARSPASSCQYPGPQSVYTGDIGVVPAYGSNRRNPQSMVSQENRKTVVVSWQDATRNQLVYSEEDPKNGQGKTKLRQGPGVTGTTSNLIIEFGGAAAVCGGGRVAG